MNHLGGKFGGIMGAIRVSAPRPINKRLSWWSNIAAASTAKITHSLAAALVLHLRLESFIHQE